MVWRRTRRRADRIENGVAVFSALDKVTATIKKLEVPINETVQFGALKVTPRACYSRPPTEQPQDDDICRGQRGHARRAGEKLFSGWMFAESPGLNAVEHPVFDVWLTECQKPQALRGATAAGAPARRRAGSERRSAPQMTPTTTRPAAAWSLSAHPISQPVWKLQRRSRA